VGAVSHLANKLGSRLLFIDEACEVLMRMKAPFCLTFYVHGQTSDNVMFSFLLPNIMMHRMSGFYSLPPCAFIPGEFCSCYRCEHARLQLFQF